MDLSIFFSGLGSSIIGAIVGAILSAAISIPVSFNAGKRSIMQKQIAKDDATQIQVGTINEKQ